MTKPSRSRAAAYRILYEVLEKDAFSHIVLRDTLNQNPDMTRQERAFAGRLVHGTLNHLLELDWMLSRFSKMKIDKLKPAVRTVLRMSVYQILYMDSVPDRAVLNEAAALMDSKGLTGLKGYVNGVLRALLRGRDTVEWPDDSDFGHYASIRYSMPEWLAVKWEKELGRERTEAMLAAFLKPSQTVARCNLSLASREDILEMLAAEKVSAVADPYIPSAIRLVEYDRIDRLKCFQKGYIQIQDTGSILAGLAADPPKGGYCVDCCAAPGGKSLCAADLLGGSGFVDSRDLTADKTAMIKENIERTGFTNIGVREWDARIADPALKEKADVVIADLPCSGLGVIGRKPEIKYRITPGQLKELVSLQREILSAVWTYVKPGGRIVYSTCTVNRAENQDNVRWFLEQFPFKPVRQDGLLPEAMKECITPEGAVAMLPGQSDSDGFFIAVMERI